VRVWDHIFVIKLLVVSQIVSYVADAYSIPAAWLMLLF